MDNCKNNRDNFSISGRYAWWPAIWNLLFRRGYGTCRNVLAEWRARLYTQIWAYWAILLLLCCYPRGHDKAVPTMPLVLIFSRDIKIFHLPEGEG